MRKSLFLISPGWPVPITEEKMKERGIDFILSKPFDCAKILKEVNALLKSKNLRKDSYYVSKHSSPGVNRYAFGQDV